MEFGWKGADSPPFSIPIGGLQLRGIYIHIPFCHQICHYCDFNKVFFKNQPVDRYIEAVGNELLLLKESGVSFNQVETVFLGGGTPTSLSEVQLDRLLELIHMHIKVSAVNEFTTEANPDELTFEKLKVLKNGGVNRISAGVQSFDAELLRAIGRTHSPEDVFRVINDSQKVGFENISIDLIYGLPNQTMEQWQTTLDQALSLELPHYSGYSLIVEPKTVFYNLMRKGKLPLPGEDKEAEMFDLLMKRMDQEGRKRYEISNFAVPGYESIHNLLYWNNEEYAGIGAGAHGYLNGNRYSNIGPLLKYIETVESGSRPTFQSNPVTKKEAMEEEMFLGLRKAEGVSAEEFLKRFGVAIEDLYGEKVNSLLQLGLLEWSENRLRLTQKGVFQGNEVFQEFLLG